MTVAPISAANLAPALVAAPAATAQPTGLDAFSKLLDHLVGPVVEDQARADQALEDVVLGRSDDLHNVSLALGQADVSFRKVLEIRNRLLDAYQEIMRMQV